MEKSVFHETGDGTPQGGIISPVLANLALDGLERQLREKYPQVGKGTAKGKTAKVNLVRYADDFIITGNSKELLEDEVKPLVEQFMRERGLELSQEKTTITHIEDGFDFLGQNVRKFGDKCLTKPSKKNVKTFLDNIRAVIDDNKTATAYALIMLLNPKIRGWANYHRHAASKATFNYVDMHIFQALWRWAKRRHPMKPRGWIHQKYFGTVGNRDWRFFGEHNDDEGQTITNWLTLAVSTPIKRHMKIKGEANPYDPEWELYFEERLGVKMETSLLGRRRLSRLWKEQKGICPICNQPIDKLTGWHLHHIVERVVGGSDSSENRVLLHPECHRQVHNQNLPVSKPRPVKGALPTA
jgi:RNA-directed DNA polymerase